MQGYYTSMTNNDKITRRCCRCKMSFTTFRDEDKQWNHELNGFCSWGCEADQIEAWNRYDRYYKP